MNFRRAVLILVVILFLAGIHLYVYARNIILKYEITDLKIKLSELKSQNRQLGSQVARAEDLSQIEKIAQGKLGMVYPSKITYILPGETPNAPSSPTPESQNSE
jgi:cell division protein FtsL